MGIESILNPAFLKGGPTRLVIPAVRLPNGTIKIAYEGQIVEFSKKELKGIHDRAELARMIAQRLRKLPRRPPSKVSIAIGPLPLETEETIPMPTDTPAEEPTGPKYRKLTIKESFAVMKLIEAHTLPCPWDPGKMMWEEGWSCQRVGDEALADFAGVSRVQPVEFRVTELGYVLTALPDPALIPSEPEMLDRQLERKLKALCEQLGVDYLAL
jgi:hypothetical protein